MSQTDTIAGLGARTDHVAVAPLLDPARLALTVEERSLLGQIGRVATIGDVVARSGMPEARAISVLLALRMKGAIVPARVNAVAPAGASIDAALLEEVDLEPTRKREILELDRQLDRIDFFSLLGVSFTATGAEVKRAYFEASKKFHPDRYFGKNLGSYKGRIERIFKKLTEAQATLGDETKRRAYLQARPDVGASASPPTPAAPARSAEQDALSQARDAERRARLARHPYLLRGAKSTDLLAAAKSALAEGDFRAAMTQLDQLTQLDPKNAAAKQLLEQARRSYNQERARRELDNGKQAFAMGETAKALEHLRTASRLDPDSAHALAQIAMVLLRVGGGAQEARPLLQRACELEPRNATYRHQLALAHLELGMKSLAKRYFEETVQLDPNHAEAKAQLKKFRWPF